MGKVKSFWRSHSLLRAEVSLSPISVTGDCYSVVRSQRPQVKFQLHPSWAVI